jgi:hypothetical protein
MTNRHLLDRTHSLSMLHQRQTFYWLLATLACCASGCHDTGVPLVKVTGRITFNNGDWPRPGVIYFAPLGMHDGIPQRPGSATFSTDGKFRAGTFTTSDGLIPGKYRINIECWEHPPSMAYGAPVAKSCVPKEFQSGKSSGLEIVVPLNSRHPVEVYFDVHES